jgi:hypothetical protein
MNDPYLAALVNSVEKGGDPVLITLTLTSGAVVSGVLRHSRYFVDVTHNEFSRVAFVGAKIRNPEAAEAAKATAYEQIESFKIKFDASEADAITLSEVKMIWSNGDGR